MGTRTRAAGAAAPGRDATSPLAVAQLAVDLAPTQPDRSRALASTLPLTPDDPEISCLLARAAGLACLAEGDPATATDHLVRAVAYASDAGLRRRAAEARMSLAYARFAVGDTLAALETAERAAPDLDGAPAARLQATRGLIKARLGRREEARAELDGAIRALRAEGDRLWEARALDTRGWVHAALGNWSAADADLAAAEALFRAAGDEAAAAGARHNRGYAAALRGDLPAALARYGEAETVYAAAGASLAALRLDRAQALLAAGLGADAVAEARAALREATARDAGADIAEAALHVASAALLAGDHQSAADAAEQALARFREQGRTPWEQLAAHVAMRARWEAGDVGPGTDREFSRIAGALEAAGWSIEAADAWLLTTAEALREGDREMADAATDRLARHRRTGPPAIRLSAWHAEALRRAGRGDRRGAAAAVRAGLRVLDRFRATLGATELRVSVSAHGRELAELGVRLALESGRPSAMLDATERWRAAALRVTPARPDDDPALAGLLSELRAVAAGADEAIRDGLDASAWVERRSELERAIARATRARAGSDDVRPALDRAALQAALDDRALVTYTSIDGVIHAVTLVGGRARLRRLGPLAEVERDLAFLRAALHRLAGDVSPRRVDAAMRSMDASVGALTSALLDPLPEVGRHDGEVVLVPTGSLHALPWAALPPLGSRPITIAPSATAWAHAAQRPAPDGDGRVLLAAGPRLEHAPAEVEALADRYGAALLLTGDAATCDHVREGMDGAAIAHLACHGRFRSDNPLFSELTLADGPLTVHDLDRLHAAPRLIVLSACDAGLSAAHPGDELMGMATALLGAGTSTLVASVLPVPDHLTRELMLAFHRELGPGRTAADALARAGAALRDDGPQGLAAAVSFSCLGAAG